MSEVNNQPIPQGNYLPATRHGDIIFTAGMTPRRNGELIQSGKIKTAEPVSAYKESVIQAVKNAIAAAESLLEGDETLAGILSLTVYVHAEQDFEAHSRIADFASIYLREVMGEKGIGSRAAVGVATLPGNAPVEIQLIASVVE